MGKTLQQIIKQK